MVIAQLCDYTNNHCIVLFKWVNVWYMNHISIEVLNTKSHSYSDISQSGGDLCVKY